MNDRAPVKRSLYPHLLGITVPLLVEPAVRAPYLSIANWLAEFWSWPDARRTAWRDERLRRVLGHAARQVPFYRELLAGRAPERVCLDELPVVDKPRLRDGGDAFRADGWQRMDFIAKATGGSTYGEPWEYVLDKQAWAQMYGSQLHLLERTGYRYGEPTIKLGLSASMGGHKESFTDRLRHRIERRDFSLAGTDMEQAASLARARRAAASGAVLWYGYAGILTAMADAVLAAGVRLRGPRVIVSTAETLRPEWRKRIEAAFEAPLFNEYGCNDGGVIGLSCGSGRFHLADNLSIVEVVDRAGTACPPGTEGEVVVTNLHARVLPFLRYSVGDRAVLGDGPCPCGRPGSTLERVAGRQVELVKLPSGAELSSFAFVRVFEHTPTIRRWQLVQTDPHHLKVRLHVNPAWDASADSGLRAVLNEICRRELVVTTTTDEPIEFTAGGKHPVLVRATGGR